MYSKRSPPTVLAGMELPYISIPSNCGIAPSTGISLLRRYSSMLGSTCRVAIGRIRYCPQLRPILESADTIEVYESRHFHQNRVDPVSSLVRVQSGLLPFPVAYISAASRWRFWADHLRILPSAGV